MHYIAPKSLEDVVSVASEHANLRFLAGGTDLLTRMQMGVDCPDCIVDVKHIPEMREISFDGECFYIGAATPCTEITEHRAFSASWPGVSEAAGLIGSTQIQGRCTLGGNLGNCSPAADSVPALIASNCVAVLKSSDGTRECKIEEIPRGPGKTRLRHGEIVVGFKFPGRSPNDADAYLRMIPRTEMDIAIAGCAVNISMDEQGVVWAARVALGAVAPTAMSLPAAADCLIGSELDNDVLERAAHACRLACDPINDKRGTIEYRTKMAGVLFVRAVRTAAARINARRK